MKLASKSKSRGLSERDRLNSGREELKNVSYKQLGHFHPSAKRDCLATLKEAEAHRLPKLLPVKYQRMLANAFTFFRGSAGIMAKDLAGQPHTHLFAHLCGDAHVQNLGWYGAPDGRIVFDINDFDETTAGPWEWDVKRMAASIVLAGEVSKQSHSACERATEVFARNYCGKIAELAAEPTLLAARHVIHRVTKSEPVDEALRQAERENSADLLKKYATKADDGYRFKKVAGEWPLSDAESKRVLRSLARYRDTLPAERLHFFEFYRAVDVAFKVVGTGSVALRDYVVLMEGRNPDDALFMQIKQEVKSTYAPYLKRSEFDNQGERVVDGQRRIQPVSDLLLGWTRIDGNDFLVRQLNDHKGSLDLTTLKADGLESLANLAGQLLARGHARSGDALALLGYIGDGDKLTRAISKFAQNYVNQVAEDFEEFENAVKDGRIKTAS